MSVAPLWSFLFFFMLINLALSSIGGAVQTTITFLTDEWPFLIHHRIKVVLSICTLYYLLGLPMCCGGGIHLFTVFDSKCSDSLLWLTFFEIILVSWFYGMDQFFSDLAEMGMIFWNWLKLTWTSLLMVITPLILFAIAVLSWFNHEILGYGDYEYPQGIQILGWVFEIGPMAFTVLFPIWPLYKSVRNGDRGKDILRYLFRPTPNWYNTVRGETKASHGDEDLYNEDESDEEKQSVSSMSTSQSK